MSAVEKRCACRQARWPKCAHPWYLKKIRHRRQEYAPNITRYAREVLKTAIETKTHALEIADRIRVAIHDGTYVSAKALRGGPIDAPATRGLTLREVAARFVASFIDADVLKRRRSKGNDRGIVTALCTHRTEDGRELADRPMAGITIDDLVAFRAARAYLASSSWNKYRTVLGQLWRWARWSGYLDVDLFLNTPPDMLKRLGRKKTRQRNRPVNDEELNNVLASARALRYEQAATRLYAIIVAAIETGCRVGELLALQWRDVNPALRQMFIRAEEEGGAKTGQARTIELSQRMIDLLETVRCDAAGQELPRLAYVFGTEDGSRVRSISKAWNTAVLRAHRIEPKWTKKKGKKGGDLTPACRAHLRRIDLNIHDLRHEAGLRLLRSGCFDLAQIKHRYGHASLAQTAGYLQATAESMRKAQEEFDAWRTTRSGSNGEQTTIQRPHPRRALSAIGGVKPSRINML
jgi:integrase